MGRQGRMSWATVMMAFLWIVLSGASSEGSVVFFEDTFDGAVLDGVTWNGDIATSGMRFCPVSAQNHHLYGSWQDVSLTACSGSTQAAPYGGVSVQNGAASFSSEYNRTFPYIWAGPPSRWSPFPETGDFTFEVRMQYTSIRGNGDGIQLLSWENSDPLGNNPPMPLGQSVYGIWADSGGLYGGGATIPAYSAAATAYHTYRLDYVNGAYSVYLDGVLKSGPTANAKRPNALWIGNPVYTSWGIGDWSDFSIDYIRVTIPESVCIESPSNIVGWWPGDNTGAAMLAGSKGILLGGAAFAEGMVGQAFSFDGISGTVNVPQSASLNVGDQATVDFWLKSDSVADLTSCCKGLVTTDFYGIEISGGYDGTAGVNFFVNTGGSFAHTSDANAGGAVVTAGAWHHIAGTYDGSRLQLYIDGRPWGNPTPHTGAILPMSAAGFLSIGSEEGRMNEPQITKVRYFNGLIDEVEIHNRALTAEEIRNIYRAGSAGKCRANYVPAADAGQDQTAEMTSCAGAAITLDGSASSDQDGNPLTFVWTENGEIIATGVNPAITLSYGSHTITLTVNDGMSGTASDTVVINVVDTTAPVLNVTLSPNVLRPPNHKYVKVVPSISVTDACAASTTTTLLSATSNQPDNGLGDGDSPDDIVINADGSVSLRAERSGRGQDRVYLLTYQAIDIGGNSATATATVTVPHDSSCDRDHDRNHNHNRDHDRDDHNDHHQGHSKDRAHSDHE